MKGGSSRTLCTFICVKRIPVMAKRKPWLSSRKIPRDGGIDRAEKRKGHGKAVGDARDAWSTVPVFRFREQARRTGHFKKASPLYTERKKDNRLSDRKSISRWRIIYQDNNFLYLYFAHLERCVRYFDEY